MRVTIAAVIALSVLGGVFTGQAFAGDISRQANMEYIAANLKKPGVTVTPSGLI